jgi:desulfoferrodoxin (superoxide reductase-like protein)
MKGLLTLIAIVGVLSMGGSAFGHAPKSIEAGFDTEAHLLNVVVSHDTKDAAKHFVDKIEIKLNGKKIVEQQFASQQDKAAQEAVYRVIDAAVGDEIEIVAGCNISGKKKATITVEKAKRPKKADEQQEY